MHWELAPCLLPWNNKKFLTFNIFWSLEPDPSNLFTLRHVLPFPHVCSWFLDHGSRPWANIGMVSQTYSPSIRFTFWNMTCWSNVWELVLSAHTATFSLGFESFCLASLPSIYKFKIQFIQIGTTWSNPRSSSSRCQNQSSRATQSPKEPSLPFSWLYHSQMAAPNFFVYHSHFQSSP